MQFKGRCNSIQVHGQFLPSQRVTNEEALIEITQTSMHQSLQTPGAPNQIACIALNYHLYPHRSLNGSVHSYIVIANTKFQPQANTVNVTYSAGRRQHMVNVEAVFNWSAYCMIRFIQSRCGRSLHVPVL